MRVGRLQMVVEIGAENFLRLCKLPGIQKMAGVFRASRRGGFGKLLSKR